MLCQNRMFFNLFTTRGTACLQKPFREAHAPPSKGRKRMSLLDHRWYCPTPRGGRVLRGGRGPRRTESRVAWLAPDGIASCVEAAARAGRDSPLRGRAGRESPLRGKMTHATRDSVRSAHATAKVIRSRPKKPRNSQSRLGPRGGGGTPEEGGHPPAKSPPHGPVAERPGRRCRHRIANEVAKDRPYAATADGKAFEEHEVPSPATTSPMP